MRYIVREVPCCCCCPEHEYNRTVDVHWCDALEMILEVDKNTVDPGCPLPDSRDEFFRRIIQSHTKAEQD